MEVRACRKGGVVAAGERTKRRWIYTQWVEWALWGSRGSGAKHALCPHSAPGSSSLSFASADKVSLVGGV